MNDSEISKLLEFFFKVIRNQKLIYRFSGSFALKIQGMELIPKDIDIICDNFSFLEFKYLFEKYIILEGRKENLFGDYFLININEINVDFFCFDDENIAKFNKIYTVTWKKFELPVISLYETKIFYEETKRFDKSQKIKNYLDKVKYEL